MAVLDELHSSELFEWKSIEMFNNKLEQWVSNKMGYPLKHYLKKVQNQLIETALKKRMSTGNQLWELNFSLKILEEINVHK